MHVLTRLISFACVACLAGPLGADEHSNVSWQDAVAELASEKTRAETCVSLAKKAFDPNGPQLASVQLDYGAAKAQMDAIIGGLVVALVDQVEPQGFSSYDVRMMEAVTIRKAMCENIVEAMPNDKDEQTKGIIGDVLGKSVAAMISAVKDIYIYHEEEDIIDRTTIQTQVEATRWREFVDIPG